MANGGNSHQRKIFATAVAKKARELLAGDQAIQARSHHYPWSYRRETGKLERPNIEAYAGLGIAIWLAVVPMTWWLRCILLMV